MRACPRGEGLLLRLSPRRSCLHQRTGHLSLGSCRLRVGLPLRLLPLPPRPRRARKVEVGSLSTHSPLRNRNKEVGAGAVRRVLPGRLCLPMAAPRTSAIWHLADLTSPLCPSSSHNMGVHEGWPRALQNRVYVLSGNDPSSIVKILLALVSNFPSIGTKPIYIIQALACSGSGHGHIEGTVCKDL